jgi:hypothetical protein
MNNKEQAKKAFDPALTGKQQLLIKSKLQRNALVAKQQLIVKAALAGQQVDRRNGNL